MVEVMTSSALILIALTMFGAALFISSRTQVRDSEYSTANDSANLAIAMIDRQVRSGYVMPEPPSLGVRVADAVTVYTLSNGIPECVIWAVASIPDDPLGAQGLYFRSWNAFDGERPSDFGEGAGWRLALGSIRSASSDAFIVDHELAGRDVLPRLTMLLHLNASKEGRAGQEIEIRSTFTSRNSPRALDPFQSDSEVDLGDVACV